MSEAITTVKTETIAKSTTGQWYVFVVDLSWVLEPRGLAVALHLGLAATVLSYVLYMRGLITTPASSAVTLALAEPLSAALLGIVLLDERLPPLAWLGIACIFGGLAL